MYLVGGHCTSKSLPNISTHLGGARRRWPLTSLAERSAEFEALTTDLCDPALDGFAQLLDLPLSGGLHLRGVSAEVSRDRRCHCLHVQRLVERIPRAAMLCRDSRNLVFANDLMLSDGRNLLFANSLMLSLYCNLHAAIDLMLWLLCNLFIANDLVLWQECLLEVTSLLP